MISLLIDHLLESTAFAVLMGLLTLCFANNRADVRYGLWFAASLKFLIPFSLIVMAGNALRWETAPAVPLDLSWSVPIATPDLRLPAILADVATVTAPRATPPTAATTVVEDTASGPDIESTLPESVLLALWLGGMALLLCRWMVQWFRLLRVRWASTPSEIDVAIPVRFSRMLFEPGLVGIFRPVLLLPEGIIARLSATQLALVIEHELCHWRRRDNLTAAIHMTAELVFWFHPLIWWIGTRLVAERERACDENVLAAGGDPKAYAHSILEVCRFYMRSPLTCASGVAGANLKHRVRRIMENMTFTRLSRAKLAVLATVAASALLLPMASGFLTPDAAAAQPVPAVSPPTATQAVALPSRKPVLRKAPPAARIFAKVSIRAPMPDREAMLRALTASKPMDAPNMEDIAVLLSQDAQPEEQIILAANTIPQAGPPAQAAMVPKAPPPSSPMEEIVVTAKKIREFVRTRNFVRNYTAPSEFLDQISRWHQPLCVHTEGLAPGFDAFVTARVKEVAAQIGAPKAQSDACKTNLSIIFSEHPQELLDYIKTKRPELLGPHYPALRKQLATVNHPVQAWYATSTRDYNGRSELDTYDAWWGSIPGLDGFGAPVYVVPGSHLRSGLTSEFASVVVVADTAKVADWEIGTIADYVAMTAFARTKTLDKCQQVPSITNVFADCNDSVRAKTLSAFDMAYLKALYITAGDAPRGLQESGISRAMQKILEKQLAEGKTAD